MKLTKVYRLKTGPINKRLKVRINNKLYHCGANIIGTDFYVSYINAESKVTIRDTFGLNEQDYQLTVKLSLGRGQWIDML